MVGEATVAGGAKHGVAWARAAASTSARWISTAPAAGWASSTTRLVAGQLAATGGDVHAVVWNLGRRH